MTRRLTLRFEHLTELTGDDLSFVGGVQRTGDYPTGVLTADIQQCVRLVTALFTGTTTG